MSTAEYDHKVYDESQQFEDDKKLFVQFFMEAIRDPVASEQQGRPIFREQPNVRIMVPGSRDVTVTRATLAYQERFAKQWERFKKQLEQADNGTPLEQVPWLTIGIIAELKAVNCTTLEALAGLSDMAISKMMGMQQFRTRAQNFLALAAEAAPFTQMQAQLEERDTKIAVLQQQMVELQKLLQKQAESKG